SRTTRNGVLLDERSLTGHRIPRDQFTALDLTAQLSSDPNVRVLRRCSATHGAPLARKGLDQTLVLKNRECPAHRVAHDGELLAQGGFGGQQHTGNEFTSGDASTQRVRDLRIHSPGCRFGAHYLPRASGTSTSGLDQFLRGDSVEGARSATGRTVGGGPGGAGWCSWP